MKKAAFLLNKVKQTIDKHGLVRGKNKILVAVSGGPDSVFLLYALTHLKKELGISLHIAHLDHMLRGKESDRDADFVRTLAAKLEVPVTLERIDITALAKKGSLEEIARNARLEFFFRTAKKLKADKIALGHTRDDQSETVLMRLLRGAGLLGLRGILPKRKIGGFTIIRPLIETSRKEIELFLKAKKIKTRADMTNFSLEFFRNRIRLELLPLFERYNPKIKEVLANTAEALNADYDFLARKSVKALKNIKGKGKADTVNLKLEKLLKSHPAMQNMVLRLSFEALKGDTRRLNYKHILELKDLLSCRPVSSIVDLPSNISAVKTKQYISLYKRH